MQDAIYWYYVYRMIKKQGKIEDKVEVKVEVNDELIISSAKRWYQ